MIILSGVGLILGYRGSVVLLHCVQCFHPGLDGLRTPVCRRESSVIPSTFGALVSLARALLVKSLLLLGLSSMTILAPL